MKPKVAKVKTNLLSIDIGNHSVKIAVGQKSGDKLKVTNLVKQQLPNGVFDDGRLVDELTLKTVIQSLIKENHIKIKDAVLTYESQDIIKREMIVQKVDVVDQLDLITFEVSQYLPIDIEAYVLQYQVLEEIEEDNNVKLKILIGAVPRETVKMLYDLLHNCGLNPLYMDMHSNSLEKFIEYSFDSIRINKTIAFIDFGHKIIDISIFENGKYKFNRLLRLGSGEFDRILVEQLDLPIDEAELRKKKTSLMAINEASTQEEFDVNDVKKVVIKETANYVNECMDEISKVFKYYTSRNVDNTIDHIYVCGGGSQFKDLVSLFRERFEINTDVMNNYGSIEIASKNPVEELPVYVHAVGALIRK